MLGLGAYFVRGIKKNAVPSLLFSGPGKGNLPFWGMFVAHFEAVCNKPFPVGEFLDLDKYFEVTGTNTPYQCKMCCGLSCSLLSRF